MVLGGLFLMISTKQNDSELNRKELLKDILLAGDDKKRADVIRNACKGLKLYRYRSYYDGKPKYEIEALKERKLWASNPRYFDDKDECTIPKFGNEDIDTIMKLKDMIDSREAHKELESGKAGRAIPDNLKAKTENVINNDVNVTHNREAIRKFKKGKRFNEYLNKYRNGYKIACFTEVGPTSSEMWNNYARSKDGTIAGFCLEYNIEDILDANYVISPVFYEDDMTLTDFDKQFENHIESIFCHKKTQGYDHNKHKFDKKKIFWIDQKEWRIVKERDLNGQEKKGGYIENIIPSNIYLLKGESSTEDISSVWEATYNSEVIRLTIPLFPENI